MKAGELIKQEPFAEIFTATLSRFLTLRFGGEWQVSWDATAQSSRAQSRVEISISMRSSKLMSAAMRWKIPGGNMQPL